MMTMRAGRWLTPLALLMCVGAEMKAWRQFEDHWVKDRATGLRLYLRRLTPEGKTRRGAVLFVHGATFASGLAAGYRFVDGSWMDHLAGRGFDVWALDFAGYGRSERYREGSGPLGRAWVASGQIESAVEYLRQRSQVKEVAIVAHSWGTIAAGVYLTQAQRPVGKLVLFGPVAQREGKAGKSEVEPWHCVSVGAQRRRFYEYVPEGERAVLDPREFERWGKAYLASDEVKRDCVMVPNGPSQDVAEAWAGHLAYDPGMITQRSLIVRGEWETVTRADDAQWLWSRLGRAAGKRDVLIDRGTHVMHLEERRRQLYEVVAAFLSEM